MSKSTGATAGHVYDWLCISFFIILITIHSFLTLKKLKKYCGCTKESTIDSPIEKVTSESQNEQQSVNTTTSVNKDTYIYEKYVYVITYTEKTS